MPIPYNDSLDENPVYDGQQEFRGMATWVKASLLQPNQIAMLLNGLVTTKGSIVSRPGRVQIGAETRDPTAPIRGLGYLDTPTSELLFRVRAGQVEVTTDVEVNSHLLHPWETTGYTVDAEQEVEFAQLAEKFYLADGSRVSEWDGSTFQPLANSPAVGVLVRMQGRLFGAVHPMNRDYLYESDVLDGSVWEASTRSLRIGEGEGDPIVGLMPWYKNVLLVAKEGSMATVTIPAEAVSMTEYVIDRVAGDYGCIAPRTLSRVGNDVWFLSREGVRSVRRMAAQADQEVSLPISEPIQDIIDRINERAITTSSAFHIGNFWCLALPLGDALSPNAVVIYNTMTQQWCGAIPGWYPQVWCMTRFAGQKRLVYGDKWGRVHWWRIDSDTWFRDLSNGHETQYTTTAGNESLPSGTLSEVLADARVWEKLSVGANEDITFLPDPHSVNTALGERRNSLSQLGPDVPWGDGPPIPIVFVIPDLPWAFGGVAYPVPDVGTVTALHDQQWKLVEQEWYHTTIITRSYQFGDPMSLKTGDRVEMEFRDSLAKVQVFARLDGGPWRWVPPADWDGETVSAGAALPQMLPFNLATTGSTRKRWNLLPLGRWREIQFKIVGVADRLGFRETFASAWVNALEGER